MIGSPITVEGVRSDAGSWYEYDISESHPNYKNTSAKGVNDFNAKTIDAGGFWIGRYEARKSSSNLVTEKSTDNVYVSVTQPDAASLCGTMYESNDFFESDLINSYAWDTCVLFLQEYDNRASQQKLYSITNPTSSSVQNKGTTDKICNVYDIASNCFEWTTETYMHTAWGCCARGGKSGDSTSSPRSRICGNTSHTQTYISFRPILYLKKK